MKSAVEAKQFISKHINAVYHQAYWTLKEKYRQANHLYGEPFDDLYQDAVTDTVANVQNQHESGEDISLMQEGYFMHAIMNNFKQRMWKSKEHCNVVAKYSDRVEVALYDDSGPNNVELERSEMRDLMAQFRGRTKSFLKMLRSGDNVRDIQRRLDMGTSMRKFYQVRERIQNCVQEHGYDEF